MESIQEKLRRLFAVSNNTKNVFQLTKNDLALSSEQFPGVKESQHNKQDVRIGLDFGTAFTKVVVSDGIDFYAISFKEYSAEDEYLLPSVLYLDENRNCHLGDGEKCTTKSRLKDWIILNEFDELMAMEENLFGVIFFLSLVLQQTRHKFMHDHWDQYREKYLIWHLNVGMPTANVADKQKRNLYLNLSRIAWYFSLEEGPLNFDFEDKVEKIEQEQENIEELLKDRIEVFPECDALLLSYEKSIEYRLGHHILVDVGAGTMDVTYISVFEWDGRQRHVVYEKSIENYGTAMAIRYLSEKANSEDKLEWNRQEDFPNDDFLIANLDLENIQLSEYKKEFMGQCTEQLKFVSKSSADKHWGRLDMKRLEKGEMRYAYILTGGGSNAQLYIDTVEDFASTRQFPCGKLKLSKPSRLNPTSINQDQYLRLIVAYGLAWPKLDIAETIFNPPSEERKSTHEQWNEPWRKNADQYT